MPAVRSELVGDMGVATGFSQRRVCTAMRWSRTSVRFERKRSSDEEVRVELRAISAEHPRFGYRRAHAMVRRTPRRLARKTVQRLWRAEKLQVPRKRKVKPAKEVVRKPMEAPSRPNQGWALDLTHEQLGTGECFRILVVLDEFTRVIILTQAATNFKGSDVRELVNEAMRNAWPRKSGRARTRAAGSSPSSRLPICEKSPSSTARS